MWRQWKRKRRIEKSSNEIQRYRFWVLGICKWLPVDVNHCQRFFNTNVWRQLFSWKFFPLIKSLKMAYAIGKRGLAALKTVANIWARYLPRKMLRFEDGYIEGADPYWRPLWIYFETPPTACHDSLVFGNGKDRWKTRFGALKPSPSTWERNSPW